MVLERDIVEQDLADDLPRHAKHQVLRALEYVGRSDVHQAAPDGLGRVDGEVVVLYHLKLGQIGLLVEGALVYGARLDDVHELGKRNSVLEHLEERIRVGGVHGEALRHERVVAQNL